MRTLTPFEKFSVGDVVKVVDVPYETCVFGWTEVMSRYCGMDGNVFTPQSLGCLAVNSG